ncbi:AI-2E family transporter [Crateriforma conspicua]|uniref:AI-2 transport protein TqsA n=1 Tax=Crateriforma conspicua TaxID=2527996 RepID=A0A5C6FPX3_9PLAN|nr:AI-2E family transporter [Crateriforma conspicua]TWU62131.1 AI-2 transport protein TqsA [Crateriforma conspicua]
MAKAKSDLATIAAVAQLLGVVVAVAALFFAREVFIPLALGLLLSFLLSPIVDRLHRWGVPNVAAVVATAALAFLFLAGLFSLLGRELTTLVGQLPEYRHELIDKARGVAGLTGGVGGSLDELAEDVSEAIEEGTELEPGESEADDAEDPSAEAASSPTLIQKWTDRLLPEPLTQEKPDNDGSSLKRPLYVKTVQPNAPLASWATTAGTVLGPLATAGLVSVFALFLLIYRDDLRDRIIAVVSHGDYVTTTEAMNEAGERISRYLIAQTMINVVYGILLAVGLSLIGALMTDDGFPNAVLWGVLAIFLRYIPYLGPTAAAVFPSTIALAVFPGYSVFLTVVVLIATMELICNNIVEPWLYGSSTGISAIAVITAAVFWGWLWGPVGLLLSTPLTVCLVVAGRYVPSFRILTTLLGEDVQIKPGMRFYQRLLAGDELRASELLRERIESQGFPATCDDVIVPALKRIRQDHDADHLNEADANRLFALAGGLIADCKTMTGDPADEVDASLDDAPGLPTMIGCTSHHFSETLVLNLLRIGGGGTYHLNVIDDDVMPDDAGRTIKDHDPPMVVIAVLPKGGFPQTRYLCQAIRDEGYTGPIIVSALGRFKNYDRLFVGLRKAGATYMTTTFTQTQNKMESLLRRHARPACHMPSVAAAEPSP